ncbi:hypothetical protein FACS1894189_5360 [Planctomycetales bacterium]|nr:hypothetical protein FACS1894189_5360 [Planctomycetales bacterium]
MRRYYFIKPILEWAFFGIFFVLALIAFATSKGAEPATDWQGAGIEDVQTADNDDIEAKVDEPLAIPQQDTVKKGIVWGKTNKAKEGTTELEPKPADVPKAQPVLTAPKTAVQRSSVQHPVLPAPTPNGVAAKTAVTPSAEGKYLLKSSRKKGSTDLVETLLEVTGDVKQVANDQKQTSNKMEVVAGFRYEERIDKFSLTTDSLVSVRQYNLAKSKMKIGDRIKTPELDPELQTIVCSLEKDKVSLFSPKGSLRGEQLLLIEDLPGNTLTLDRLLPNKEVAVGETWKITDSVLRSFISVDAVTESNVEAVLTAVADNMAMVEVIGDVSGVYLGAATEMSIRAKYQFDIAAKRINWLGLLIEENRSIGHVGPGLDLVARLQVKISPNAEPQALNDETLADINTKPNTGVLKLKYDGGKAAWRFSHDRSWYVFQDDPQTTILRKLEKGELVAQCNIADMGTVDVKTMTSIDKFQKDLIAGLGKNFGKVAAAEEHENKQGYKVYTVLIDGTVDDMSLRWIYNLMTDKVGRQSVVVFVVEADKLEQFGDADDVLLETYRMGRK